MKLIHILLFDRFYYMLFLKLISLLILSTAYAPSKIGFDLEEKYEPAFGLICFQKKTYLGINDLQSNCNGQSSKAEVNEAGGHLSLIKDLGAPLQVCEFYLEDLLDSKKLDQIRSIIGKEKLPKLHKSKLSKEIDQSNCSLNALSYFSLEPFSDKELDFNLLITFTKYIHEQRNRGSHYLSFDSFIQLFLEEVEEVNFMDIGRSFKEALVISLIDIFDHKQLFVVSN